MPKLYEYQGKKLLRDAGVRVPEGAVVSSPAEARVVADKLGKPAVIKSQVGATGRFKAGGIKFTSKANEAETVAQELLGKEIKGLKVEKVLVEEKLAIEEEFYAGVIINDSCKVKGPVLMFSPQGGVDIEEVAAKSHEKVVSMNVDVLKVLKTEEVRKLLSGMDIAPSLIDPLSQTVHGLYKVFKEYDARSAEINPLVLTTDGKIYAAD